MKVQDLNKELSPQESAAVRGGTTTDQIGLNVGGSQAVGGGISFASPATQVSGPQVNANTSTTTEVDVASIANSALAGVDQLGK